MGTLAKAQALLPLLKCLCLSPLMSARYLVNTVVSGDVDVLEVLFWQRAYFDGHLFRQAFLNFATGCPTLPPGGIANLHPRLTVVKKTGSETAVDKTYPSVNTCVHYLKLPEYSSIEVMKSMLLTAFGSKGFHLN